MAVRRGGWFGAKGAGSVNESKIKPLKHGVRMLKRSIILLLFCTFACVAFAQQAQTQGITRPQGRPVIEQKQQPRVTEQQESPQKTLDRATDILQLVAKMIGVLVALIAILLALAGWLGFFEYRRWKEIRKGAEEQLKVIQRLREKAEEEKEKLSAQIGVLSLTEKPSAEDREKLDELSRRLEWVEAFGGSLSAEDYVNRGINLFQKGKTEFALEAFEKATEIDSKYVYAWLNKGWALGNLGRHEDALKANEKAIEIKPDYALAWINKGLALHKLGHYDEALKSYDKAIEIDTGLAIAWFNRACIYALMKKKKEALSDLKRAIEFDASYKEKAKTDDDFKNLRDDPDFKKLVE